MASRWLSPLLELTASSDCSVSALSSTGLLSPDPLSLRTYSIVRITPDLAFDSLGRTAALAPAQSKTIPHFPPRPPAPAKTASGRPGLQGTTPSQQPSPNPLPARPSHAHPSATEGIIPFSTASLHRLAHAISRLHSPTPTSPLPRPATRSSSSSSQVGATKKSSE